MIEDYDLISSVDYYREGSLTIGKWLKSFRNLKEAAWYHSKDMRPFMKMCGDLMKRIVLSFFRKLPFSKRQR